MNKKRRTPWRIVIYYCNNDSFSSKRSPCERLSFPSHHLFPFRNFRPPARRYTRASRYVALLDGQAYRDEQFWKFDFMVCSFFKHHSSNFALHPGSQYMDTFHSRRMWGNIFYYVLSHGTTIANTSSGLHIETTGSASGVRRLSE